MPPDDNNAFIVFSNNGTEQIIDKVILDKRGEGVLNISKELLPSGTYNYTLYVDYKQIDTKRMGVE